MKSIVPIFEIPALDISRAVTFYETVLGLQIERIDMPEMKMGIFTNEDEITYGSIVEGDGYVPSDSGVTVYLDAGDDLQHALDKIESAGGEVIVPKTPHADESGFFALFKDSEGNKLGLHSVS